MIRLGFESEIKLTCVCGRKNPVYILDICELDSAEYKCECGYQVFNAEYSIEDAIEGIKKKLEADKNESD